MRAKKGFLLRVAIGLLLLAVGCSGPKSEPPKIVAEINGSVVTYSRYHDSLKRFMPAGHTGTQDELSEVKKELINQIIEEELILQEAKNLNINVDNDEFFSELEGIKKEYGDELFKETIAERYGSVDNWKEEIKKKLLIRKTIERAATGSDPSEQEVKKFYLEHLKDFDVPDRVRARMIVVKTDEHARKVWNRLTPSNFAEIAIEESLSPENKDGGDLGFFSRGEMPQEFEDAVFRLKPGEISPVIKTDYGYHIFLLEEKKKGGRLKYKEARHKIIERLRADKAQDEYAAWITSLKKNAKIKIKEELL
ncbi:MAG: peptidyl-prolyl cis-trans isomerase [Deltaproteobacteria bacterium]|nr:peptidyl-prolyl cis-trans isomerase [Deltaproteobacteria bacterium]